MYTISTKISIKSLRLCCIHFCFTALKFFICLIYAYLQLFVCVVMYVKFWNQCSWLSFRFDGSVYIFNCLCVGIYACFNFWNQFLWLSFRFDRSAYIFNCLCVWVNFLNQFSWLTFRFLIFLRQAYIY